MGKVRRLLTAVLALGAVSAALSLGLQGVDALGAPLSTVAAPATWIAGWRTSFGLTVVAAWAALLLAWLSLRGSKPWWNRNAGLLALAGTGLSLALSGHASAAPPQWATRPAVFLHVIGVAYWIGALLPLISFIRRNPSQALPVVRRFSNGALVAVAVLTLAGLVLAVVQVDAPANLTGTPYGRILIAKTVLVLGLLGLAASNRLWLTPALASPEESGRQWLVRSIMAEVVLVVAILALVGLWRFTPPPRSLALTPAATAPVSVHLHTPDLMAQVTLTPGRAGTNRARIVVASGHAEPVAPKEVTLILAKPDAGIEPLERHALKSPRDTWEVDGLVLPLTGPWQVRVEVLITDFEQATLEGSITVRP